MTIFPIAHAGGSFLERRIVAQSLLSRVSIMFNILLHLSMTTLKKSLHRQIQQGGNYDRRFDFRKFTASLVLQYV